MYEDGNLWIGVILLVVFVIAIFFLICMVNQCQFLMGCCYNLEDLKAIGKKEYYIDVVRDVKPPVAPADGEEAKTADEAPKEGGVREPLLDNKVYPGQISFKKS